MLAEMERLASSDKATIEKRRCRSSFLLELLSIPNLSNVLLETSILFSLMNKVLCMLLAVIVRDNLALARKLIFVTSPKLFSILKIWYRAFLAIKLTWL